jgi:hypothetical protein
LTTSTDPFFQTHHLSTFGELGTSLKDYVQQYQSRSIAHAPSSITSISDMKRFVEEYPEFRKLGGNVSKHVALVGELSRLVGRDKLLEVGELEQGLATSSGADFKVSKTYLSFSFSHSCPCRVSKRLSMTTAFHLGTNFVSSCFSHCGIRKHKPQILRV